MKRLFLLVVAVLLALSGCDRFDNEFDKNLTDFFDDLSDAVASIRTADDLSALMQYYDNDYMNDGQSYSDMLSLFAQNYGDYQYQSTVQIQKYQEGEVSILKWVLYLDAINIDGYNTVTMTDYVRKINGEFKFVGNGAVESFSDRQAAYFTDLLDAIVANDFTSLEYFFTDDYYNNGVDRDSLFGLFDDMSPSLGVDYEVLDHDEYESKFVYELTENSTGYTLRVDDTYTVVGGEYRFCGNGNEAPDTSKQKVLVELFTGTWCPNCPTSEEALHDLKELYGDIFYYVEYHISDSYDGFYDDNDDLLDYYLGSIECPTAVFQGQLVKNGGISNQSQYETPLLDYASINAQAEISKATAKWGATEQELSVWLDYSLDEYFDDTDLYLRYAIIEETAQSNSGGYYHNAVLWKGKNPIDELMGYDGGTGYSLVINYEGDMPDDAVLVMWLQTMHAEYANDCKVYNVIEVPIEGI